MEMCVNTLRTGWERFRSQMHARYEKSAKVNMSTVATEQLCRMQNARIGADMKQRRNAC